MPSVLDVSRGGILGVISDAVKDNVFSRGFPEIGRFNAMLECELSIGNAFLEERSQFQGGIASGKESSKEELKVADSVVLV